jgi:hypothetical protein
MLPLGALAGLIVGLTITLQLVLTHGTDASLLLILILGVSGLVLGIPGGFLGTRFGTMLRGDDITAEVA